MTTRWFAITVTACLLLAGLAHAEVTSFTPEGYRFQLTVTVPGDTAAVYDSMTGDIKPWWDHSFSDGPAVLRIDPFPGGEFREEFDDSGDGVRHAVVTWAHRGEGFRMEGPLGLAGRGFLMVTTVTFNGVAGADSSTVTVDAAMMGEIDQQTATIVEKVWKHFLFERFKPYLEGTLED